MPKHEFQATQGLLHDDMRRQAGRIQKAYLEAAMNSVDAGSTNFEIDIDKEVTVMEDDGSGMSSEEIEKYFKNFGLKDDDTEDKVFGEFRRGRGQIFNYGVNIWQTQDNILVVNLDEPETRIPKDTIPVDLDNSDEDVWVEGDMVVFDTEGLGFNQQPSTEYVEGTIIEVQHYDSLKDPYGTGEEFKKLAKYIPWQHAMEIYLNNEQIEASIHPDFETDYAYYVFDTEDFSTSVSLYNMGAFVRSTGLDDHEGNRIPVGGIIVTKDELQLNNARTEVIDGCSVWKQVQDDFIVGARHHLANTHDLKDSKVKWLIRQAKHDENIFEDIKGRELLKDIKGNNIALSELLDGNFAFAPSGNSVAEEAMERKGITMVDDSFAGAVKDLATDEDADQPSVSDEVPEGQSYEDVVDDEMEYEMSKWDESSLSKRRKENLDKIRWYLKELDCYDTVSPGHSNHEDVWRNADDEILVDKDFLNSNKNKFITHVLDRVVEIAAADGDTRAGFDKGFNYNRTYRRMMQKAAQPRQDLITGNYNISDNLRLE